MTHPPSDQHRIARTFARLVANEHVLLAVLALIIGVVVAYAAIGFRQAIALVQLGFLGFSSEDVFTRAAGLPWWQLVLAPTAGGALVGLFIHYVLPERRPHGVADVIEASVLRDGRMSLRTGIASAFASAASIGVGASVGREGPVVHLGATLAAWLAERLDLSPALARTLLGCGVASAVAASFNAPIAGVFFALEVVMGHYALHAFTPIVVASVAGTIVSRIHFGDFPAFIVPDFRIVSFFEFPAFALLGVVCAGIAVALLRGTRAAWRFQDRWPAPRWLLPAAGGLLVGLIAIKFPHVLGVGYEATDAALKGQLVLEMLLAVLIAKLIATIISLGSGFGGGVFSPSLVLGAMTGGVFGTLAALAFPAQASSAGVYTIVGMGAVAGAVLGAPISTILIVFELTADYQVTVALMVATAIASLITNYWFGKSFFYAQLAERGLDLSGGRARHILCRRRVGELISDRFEFVDRNATLGDLRRLLQSRPHANFVVVDEDRHLVGVIGFSEINEMALDPEFKTPVRAGEMARPVAVVLKAGDSLEEALRQLEASGEEFLPVIDDEQSRKVVGILRQADVLLAYNHALLEAQAEESGR